MAQGPEELRERLADVHRQLQGTRTVTGDVRELLVDVLGDIDRLLAAEGEAQAAAATGSEEPAAAAGPESNKLARRFAVAAERFEQTHPQLAANIGSVVTALSRLGI